MDKKYQHYYAKIKDIYLELPGFSYFHSPSGRFRDNPKMVGRRRIRKKLYGLLTNSETRTGSYIITGFRGVGKTSLVNQVVNQLQPRNVIFRQAVAVVTTWIILHVILDTFQAPPIFGLILSVIIAVIYSSNRLVDGFSKWFNWADLLRRIRKSKLEYEEYFKKEKRLSSKRRKREISGSIESFRNLFILDHDYYKSSNADKLTFFVCYSGLLEFFITGTLSLGGKHLDITLFNIAIQLIGILAISHIAKWSKDHWRFNKGDALRKETHGLINLFKQNVNHSQKVFVRLSFPQEAITSKDILKSLVQNMYKELQSYRGFNRRLSRFLLGLLILLVATGLYNTRNVSDGISQMKAQSWLSYYYPSQSVVLTAVQHDSIRTIFTRPDNESVNSSRLQEYDSLINEYTQSERVQSVYTSQLRPHTVVIDYFLYRLYDKFYNFLSPISGIPIGGENKTLIPRSPDFSYFIWLLLAFGVCKSIVHFGRNFGLVTNQHVKRLLRDLNERCSAEMNLARSTQVNVPQVTRLKLGLSFRGSKSLRYPIATARDIENDLIRIFDELDRIPKIFAPPEFTFVFDELDKMDPDFQKDEVETEQGYESLSISEAERVRRKRELVSGIMASMKIFFTTAKAKFIFIAGREMYDASLADSSDRESYLGSIFHDIIYVSSLYKDPFDDHSHRIRKPIDITYLTERYVCGLLIPDRADYELNLKGYEQYLRSLKYDKESNGLIDEGSPEPWLREDQKRKIINLVSVFINYLAFRSKGSPMNLVKLFEDFTEEFPYREDDIFDDQEKMIIGRGNPKSYYLTFDFHAQHRISLVAGIFRPFVMGTGMHLKKYSDKILVSTSYLLDHIYKFHEFGFSWRNLELLPEIIDINRAPLLRRHIENIIDFLSESGLKRIDNGFVNFKFHRKVIEEVNLLSRNNDTESAIFNFTLDESNAIKRHYRGRLQKLNQEQKRFEGEKTKFINSAAFLESILGDLHFFDKEYDEAILYYADAVQALKEHMKKGLTLHESLIYTRTMLREALVFERMNTYGPALIKYSELVQIIRDNGKILRNNGEQDSEKRQDYEDGIFHPSGSKNKRRAGFHFAKSLYENFSIMLLPVLAKLVAIEKLSKQGITLKDSLRSDRDFHSVFNYLKKDEKYLLKVEYHLQKGDILYYKNGVVYMDYDNAESMTYKFGKDGRPHRDFNAPYSAYEEYIMGVSLIMKKLSKDFDKEIILDDTSLDNPRTGSTKVKNAVIDKYDEFTRSVRSKMHSSVDGRDYELTIIKGMLNFLKHKEGYVSELNVTHNAWNLTARLLSAIGDCLIIMCGKPSLDFFGKDLDYAFNPMSDEAMAKAIDAKSANISRTELALLYYGAASVCYDRATEVKSHAFQNKKILYVIKTYHRFFKSKDSASLAKSLLKSLGRKIIQPSNQNRNLIIFPEHSRSSELKVVSEGEPNVIEQLPLYYKFSYNTEVKMSILHWYNLYVTECRKTGIWKYNDNDFFKTLDNIPLNSYNMVNDQMVRMFELRLKSRINREIVWSNDYVNRVDWDQYKDLLEGSEDVNNHVYQSLKDQELLVMIRTPKDIFDTKGVLNNSDKAKFLIIDSIYCELRIIEGINLNNVSYIRGYYYLGCAFLSLAWWVELWAKWMKNQCKDQEAREKERYELLQHIGSHEIHYIDNPEYAYQHALSNYYQCINMHSEGSAYKSILSNMYFTEGDFHDDNQHFCAAMDRMLINNKVIRRRIRFIKDKLKDQSIFSPSQGQTASSD